MEELLARLEALKRQRDFFEKEPTSNAVVMRNLAQSIDVIQGILISMQSNLAKESDGKKRKK